MPSAAELFVQCLENEGVEYVFGIPGEETLDLNEALDHSGSIQFVPCATSRAPPSWPTPTAGSPAGPACASARSGPGATNLVTGLADAYLDRAPVVALTGQTGLSEMHKESHQYIDIVRMMKPVTKWNARIHDPAIIPEAVRKAFAVAEREKPGATHLELPDDVMEAEVTGAPVPRRPSAAGRAGRGGAAPRRRAPRRRRAAGRPGRQRRRPPGGRARAAPLLRADRPERDHHVHGQGRDRRRRPPHPLHRRAARAGLPEGLHGQGRPRRVRRLRPGRVVARGLEPDAATGAIICIDTVAAEIDEHYVPEVELTGDIAHDPDPPRQPGLGQAAGPARGAAATASSCALALEQGSDDGFPMKPQRVLRDLRELMAPDDVLISDVGAHKLWVSRLWPAHQPNTVLISNGAAAMGFAVPAAIAATLVLPRDRHVVTISGDGGFLMNVQELETAKRLGLAIVNLVWTDSAYGVIEMHQMRKFGRLAGTKFTNPDLVALAESFGLAGLRVGVGRRADADAAAGVRAGRAVGG